MKKFFASLPGVFSFNILMCLVWAQLIYIRFHNWDQTVMVVIILVIIPTLLTMFNLFMWLFYSDITAKSQAVKKFSVKDVKLYAPIKYYLYAFIIWLVTIIITFYQLFTFDFIY